MDDANDDVEHKKKKKLHSISIPQPLCGQLARENVAGVEGAANSGQNKSKQTSLPLSKGWSLVPLFQYLSNKAEVPLNRSTLPW